MSFDSIFAVDGIQVTARPSSEYGIRFYVQPVKVQRPCVCFVWGW